MEQRLIREDKVAWMNVDMLLLVIFGLYYITDIINGTISHRITSFDHMDPLDRSPLDYKLKKKSEWMGLSINILGLLTKLNLLILCIPVGYKSSWYLGMALWGSSFIISAIVFAIFFRKNHVAQGLVILTSIGTLPIFNLLLWIFFYFQFN